MTPDERDDIITRLNELWNVYDGILYHNFRVDELKRELDDIDRLRVAMATIPTDGPSEEDEDDLWIEPDEDGRFCSICDGLGHGYPGGGPCPLEDRGAWEPEDRFYF